MPSTKFDAILFDKDGTIFDSEKVSRKSWIETAKLFDLHFTAQMFNSFIGVPTLECYRIAHQQFGSDFPMDQFILETQRYVNSIKADGFPIKQGFDRFFKHIKQLDIPLGLVTSAEYQSTVSSFQKTDYLASFEVVVTVDDVVNAKPAADCYLLACEQLKVKPERVLVFEDSNIGLKAAINAGCYTVAIPDCLDIETDLQAKCKHILGSFDEAYSILEN